MIYEELKLPLPIYDRFEKQYRFAKGEAVNKVIATRDRIIPFQAIFGDEITYEDITEWTINKDDIARTLAYDLTDKIGNLDLVLTADGKTYMLYFGADISLLMSAGVYHMQFLVKGLYYYSEQFEVRCNSPLWDDIESDFSYFEYDNNGCDLGPILYQTGYKNRIYIDSDTHDDPPSVEEEGSNDGAGNFVAVIQKYIDNLNIEYLCPRYLVDALAVMCIHKNIKLTTPNRLYTGDIVNLKPTITQEDSSWNYRISIQFQQESKYINGHCCNNIQLAEPESEDNSCDTAVQNVQIIENETGEVYVTWDLLGDADRITLMWDFANVDCPDGDTVVLGPGTSYQFPDAFPKGTLQVTVTPQCNQGGYQDGSPGTQTKVLTNGINCSEAPEPPEPPEGSGMVYVENNTTVMPILNITGIPGFTCPIVNPQSGYSGTHGAFPIGTGTIRIYFSDSLSDFKNVKVFVNGTLLSCYYLGSSPRTMLFLAPGTFDDTDDIKISVNDGGCP